MTSRRLDYDLMLQDALRGIVREALAITAADGLSGDHHFYITFRTDCPGVEMPPPLRATFPEDMTIILQHQFWDLQVAEHGFSVALSFGGRRQTLAIPYVAITRFVDPSVNFGLEFKPGAEGETPPPPASAEEPVAKGSDPLPESEAEGSAASKVVSLDRFRSPGKGKP